MVELIAITITWLIQRFRRMCLIYMMHELSLPINITEATIVFGWKGKRNLVNHQILKLF